MHLLHLTCLFHIFFDIFKIYLFFDDFRPKILIFDAHWYLYETYIKNLEKNLVQHCDPQCNDQLET